MASLTVHVLEQDKNPVSGKDDLMGVFAGNLGVLLKLVVLPLTS
jgi:hypothetical protein